MPFMLPLLAAAAAAAVALPPPLPPALVVAVANVRNAHGRVRIDVCPQNRFLKDGCAWHASVPAHPGITLVTIPTLPPGDYAVQAFHDENSNDAVDQGLFGIPQEGVGFSRDAKIVFSPPKWADAMFHHAAAQRITFALRYWTGPATPADWKERHPRD